VQVGHLICMGTEKSTLNVDWKAKGMKTVTYTG